MASKGPLKDSSEALIGRRLDALSGRPGGRAVRSSMILKGPVENSSLASSGQQSHDRIYAPFHSTVSEHS